MTKVNYAPAGATHYDFFYKEVYWLKYDREWFYFDIEVNRWDLCEQYEQPEDAKEIPERERELNRLADTYTGIGYIPYYVTYDDINERRAERIEAGLINEGSKDTEPEYTHEYSDHGVRNRCTIVCDEEDPNGNIIVKNAYDEFVLVESGHVWPLKTSEQSTDLVDDEGSKEPWIPEIGEICEVTWGAKASWWLCILKDNDGAWVKRTNDELWSLLDTDDTFEFRPLKTPDKNPKQEVRDAFLVNALALKPEELYTWVTSEGVDLTPLIKELNK